MKRLIAAVSLLGSLAAVGHAMTPSLTTPIYNGVIASSQNVIVDMNAARIDYMSLTASYSSATLSTSTFVDGAKSSVNITLGSTSSYVSLGSSDTLTVSTNSALFATAGTISVNVSSAGPGPLTFSTLTINGVNIFPGTAVIVVSSTSYATWISTTINATVPNVTAAVVPLGGSTFTITCVNPGSFCNTYKVTSSTPALAVVDSTGTTTLGPAFFYNGADNGNFTISGPGFSKLYSEDVEWNADELGYSSNTAVSIANAINANQASLLTASTLTATTVLIVADNTGIVGNQYTLASSTGALTVGKATFIGGQAPASIAINGVTKTAGVNWTIGLSSVTASTGLVVAINSDPVLSTIIIATTNVTCPGCGIVYATATANGINNYPVTPSTGTIIVSSTNFTGGGVSAVNTSNNSLLLPSHGFATGTAVTFTTTAGTPPGKLFSGTNYFVVALDANDIQLASSYANATAVPPVVIGISTQTINGGGTFTVGPLAINGALGLSWYSSDDAVNYNVLMLPNNVTVSTVSFAPSAAAASTYWDFGQVNARYLELKIAGPTAGDYNLTVTPYGKSLANGY
jgi:hypothetical protein